MRAKALAIASVALPLVLAVTAGSACAGAPSWARRMAFANGLAKSYTYEDLSKSVVDSLLGDAAIKDEEKARLYKAVAEYYAGLADRARGKDALQRATAYVGKAREFLDKYADHPAMKGRHAELFDVRKRVVWFMVTIAKLHARALDDPEVPKADHAKHKAEAVSNYRTAIKAFEVLAAEKKAEEDKVKATKPQAKQEVEKWERRYNQVLADHASVRVFVNDARLDLGKLLKKAGGKPEEWRPLIQAAADDLKKMLYDFSQGQGLEQVNLRYAKAIVELGPEKDEEALGRLQEVWDNRDKMLSFKAVPCEAMVVKASILFRQKKHEEAAEALDEMIGKRTGGGWDPGTLGLDLVGARVTDILRNLEEGDAPEQFDARALSEAFLLLAEIQAARAKAYEDAKKPGTEVRLLYGRAYEIAVGVWDARMPVEPRLLRLIELWRTKGGRRTSLATLNIMIAKELKDAAAAREREPEKAKAAYTRVARLYTEVITRIKPDDKDQLRKIWENIAASYYAGGDCLSSHSAYTGISRWFPDPLPQAISYARSAIAVAQAHLEQLTKAKASPAELAFANAVIKRAYRHYEEVSGEPGIQTILEAREKRKAGDYKGALDQLRTIQPDARSYPTALQEIAVTHRVRLDALHKEQPKGPAIQSTLKSCLDAFQECIEFASKTLPKLKDPDKADERKALLDATARSLKVYCDTLMEDYANQPAKVIELTTGVKEKFPGIEEMPDYPLLLYGRMHAAHTLALGRDPQQAANALAVIDEAWKELKKFDGFRGLPIACKLGGNAYGKQAEALEARALKSTDAAEKADLTKRANALRDRGLDFWLELLDIAPHQTLGTYYYVLNRLDKRLHEPKSADYRKIVQIAPKALELFGKEDASLDQLTRVKLLLASAHGRLDAWRSAIPILEEIDAAYEPDYDKRMKAYDKLKELHDADPERYKALHDQKPASYPLPIKRPIRHSLQTQTREALGRAYLAANVKTKDALRIFAELAGGETNRDSPKFWEYLYFLCEALRVNGEYDTLVTQLFRAFDAMGSNPIKDAKGSRRDFTELLHTVRKEVDALPDPGRKKKLLPILDEIITKAGK